MSDRVPVIGAAQSLTLTWEGLGNLLMDLETAGRRPVAIVVSEYDRRELNQQIMDSSIVPVAKADQAERIDGAAIGFIRGVMITSHPDVPEGRARLVYPAKVAEQLKDKYNAKRFA